MGLPEEKLLMAIFGHSKEEIKKYARQYRIEQGKYPDEWTKGFKDKLKARDKKTCFVCNKADRPSRLHLHHINYQKDDCNPENLITLCPACHVKTNGDRDKWYKLFIKNRRVNRLIHVGVPSIIIMRENYELAEMLDVMRTAGNISAIKGGLFEGLSPLP